MTDVRRIVSENRRTVWILAAALIVNAALYVLVVDPLSTRTQNGQDEAGDATRTLVAARTTYAAARGTVTGKKQADDELQKFYRDVLPGDLSAARRMLYAYVDQLAEEANLTAGTSQFAQDTARKGTLRRLTRTLNLTGEYTNIRQFIHGLETAPEFLILESVIVTQGAGSDRRLNVIAAVATYYVDTENGN